MLRKEQKTAIIDANRTHEPRIPDDGKFPQSS